MSKSEDYGKLVTLKQKVLNIFSTQNIRHVRRCATGIPSIPHMSDRPHFLAH